MRESNGDRVESSGEREGGESSRISSLIAGLVKRRAHVRNVLSYFIVRIGAMVLYLVPIPLFISRQGSASYGTLTLLLLVFGYLQIFDLGVGYAVNQRLGRAIARENHKAGNLIRSAVPIFGAMALAVFAAVFLFAKQLAMFLLGRPAHVAEFHLIAVAVGLLTLDAMLVAILQAYNRVDWINYSRTVVDLARALGLSLGAFSANGVGVAVAVTTAGCLAKLVLDVVLALRLVGERRVFTPSINLKAIRLNLGLGMPMAGSVVVGMLMTSADRIFVGRVFGKTALAHYAVGADLCSRAYFLVWAVTGSAYTVYVRRRATRSSARDLVSFSLLAVVAVALAFYVPLAALAPQVITLWIGPAFAHASAGVVRIWAMASVAYLAMCVYYNHLQGVGKPTALVFSSVLGVAFLAAGLVVLPGRFNIDGVALAVLSGYGAQAIFLWLMSRRIMAQGRT